MVPLQSHHPHGTVLIEGQQRHQDQAGWEAPCPEEWQEEQEEEDSETCEAQVPQDWSQHNTQLHDLLTEESPEFFSIIKVDHNWLGQPVDSWEDNKDYTTAKTFVRTVKTTNDLAERAVKMATDYSQILTKDEHQEEDYPGGGGPQEGLPRLQEVNFKPLILAHTMHIMI